MSLILSSQFSQRTYSWTAWKAVQAAKNLVTQYDDNGTVYTVFGYDGPDVHICTIYKGTVPTNVQDNGYSQSQNDTDKADFQTNYLPTANAPVIPKTVDGRNTVPTAIVVDGSVSTAGTGFTRVNQSAYAEPFTNAKRSVVSTSANDTLSGSNAWAITMEYFDSNMNGPFQETVFLSGTHAVNTSGSNICYINRAWVSQTFPFSGSGLTNATYAAGTISIAAATGGLGGTIVSLAPTGQIMANRIYNAYHYVASGSVFNLLSAFMGVAGAVAGTFVLWSEARPYGGVAPKQFTGMLRCPAGGFQEKFYANPLKFTGPGFIYLGVIPDAITPATWYGGFSYYED